VTDPTKTHPLRNAIKRLDGSMKDWTVLSEARDPFRLDTPSNHRDAAWLREVFERRPLPDSIHIRWVHYRIFGYPKPNGKPYGGADWKWLSEKVVKGARWLGYIPWGADRGPAQRRPGVVPADAARSTARLGVVAGNRHLSARRRRPETACRPAGFVGAEQPYHLVLVGEKSSLRDDLVTIADRCQADWYLPDGEVSDTHIEQTARSGITDPRPLVLIYFADSDPSGHQMILSVTRKLRAFAHLADYQGLQCIAHRALLTPDQVRSYELLPQPLSTQEQRADRWVEGYDVEPCAWSRRSDLTGDLSSIIDTGVVKSASGSGWRSSLASSGRPTIVVTGGSGCRRTSRL
jgi:hypothetical protein